MAERRTRKRGVCASRARLNSALAAAGLKTQSALAVRIAEIEGLDTPPRDLVNRVFRERPVDPLSLERIARALAVEAHTLYLSSAEASRTASASEAAGNDKRAPGRRIFTPWRLAAATVSIGLLLAGAVWSLPSKTPVGCDLQEFIHPLKTPKGRLGIIVSRFANDPANFGQYLLATSFGDDPKLTPYVSVLTTCHTFVLNGLGDIQHQRETIIARARRMLRAAGAQILIWGRVDRAHIRVRFVSTRKGAAPVTVKLGGRPMAVQEESLEVPLSVREPGAAMPDVKSMALALMDLHTPAQAALRRDASRSFNTSIDWLRSVVISDENLRRSLNPRIFPARLADVNAQLCTNQRLLGEYDGDADMLQEAEKSCLNELAARSRTRSPEEWARAQIDLASVYVRLHIFAASSAGSIDLLRKAESSMQAAAKVVPRTTHPRLWSLAQRNLGAVYLRLAELTQGRRSDNYFQRSIRRTRAALEVMRPKSEPLGWAQAQQNLCSALYQFGAARGKAGIDLAREAPAHCRTALRHLTVDQSPLDWAMIQNNYAASTAVLAQLRDDKVGLKAAVREFKRAEIVYTRNRLPEQWAEVEINLGQLYCRIAQFGSDSVTYDQAVIHAENALEVFMQKEVMYYERYSQKELEGIRACRDGDSAHCACDTKN